MVSGFILLVPVHLTDETEYWDEEDNDLDADFPPEPPSPSDESEDIQLDVEQRVITWWVAVFTCTLQTLHSLVTLKSSSMTTSVSLLSSYHPGSVLTKNR